MNLYKALVLAFVVEIHALNNLDVLGFALLLPSLIRTRIPDQSSSSLALLGSYKEAYLLSQVLIRRGHSILKLGIKPLGYASVMLIIRT